MATRKSRSETAKQESEVAEVVGGGEDLGGMSFNSLMSAATSAVNAQALARESAKLYTEWLKIMWGKSEREIPQKDWRFADPAWKDNPLYTRLAKGYLAFCDSVDKVVEDNPDWKKRERAKFLTGILTSAMSPTNTLLGNPAALKKAYETGGMSLVRGTRNMVGDMVARKGLPSQVKASDFKMGENLAATPGAVVFRNEMLEVIQYTPVTAKVHEIPTIIMVPPIGKYYFMDLAPGRSFVQHAVSKGIQTFITSWRNPQKENADWGLDEYVQSLLDTVGAVCEVTGSKKVNILALCAGGILSTLLLNYMAATGDNRVNAATFGVMLLDFESEAPIGALQSRPVLKLAAKRSAKKGILPASSLATVFAWMRPNDLVWNYWVNNYLEGKDPPSFDILAWSVDGTNLPGTPAWAVPRHLREQSAAQAGGVDRAGPADRPFAHQGRDARHRRAHRSPDALEGVLPDHAAPGRQEHVRAEQRRAHRCPGQSARQSEGELLGRTEARWRSGAVAREGAEAHGHVVGGLGRLDDRAKRQGQARPRHTRQRATSRPRQGARPVRAPAGVARPCREP